MTAGRTEDDKGNDARGARANEDDPLIHPARVGGEQAAGAAEPGATGVGPDSPKAKALQDRIDDSIGAAGAGPAA